MLRSAFLFFIAFIGLNLPVRLSAQPELARPLINAYANAPDFKTKKEAYRKLERFYRYYHVDSSLVFSEDFKSYCAQNQRSFVPFIDLNIGAAYTRKLEFEKASNILLPVLEKAEKEADDTLRAKALLNLANLNKVQKRKELGLKRAFEATRLHEKMQLWEELGIDYLALAGLYSGTDTAQIYLKKAMDIALKFGYLDLKGAVLNNLGVAYHIEGKLDSAILLYKEAAVTDSVANNNHFALCFTLLNIGHAYRKMLRWDDAKIWYDKARPVCKACGNLEGEASIYLGLTDMYESQGDYKAALEAQRKLEETDKRLNQQSLSRATEELEIKYETEKKERQLAEARQLQNYLLFGAIGLVLALLSLFQYFRNKQKIKQKEAELLAQLEHAEAEKLREMDALKSTFFANVSHEFRTPLTLIISPVEQMMNGTFKGDVQKYYRIIHRNGKRLLDLVNQLLDLSKLESGKLKLQASEGDLSRFVSALAGAFESLAIRQQIDFQIITPEKPLVCFFDHDKVGKIVTNLVSNAFKFTREGGRVEVMVDGGRLTVDGSAPSTVNHLPSTVHHLPSTVHRPPSTVIKVSDTGIGISADQLPHLFERFTKSALSEVQAGSGIGLALVRELAELHGGNVEVESREGEGTTFTVTLAVGSAFFKDDELTVAVPETSVTPIVAPVTAGLPGTALAAPSGTQQPPFTEIWSSSVKPLLLIAEDNPDVRAFIVDTLAGEYKILEAENGKLALNLAFETTPDLVISDVMMPEMDGMDFCKLLKTNEKTSHIPVVMLTALAGQEDKLKGLETGADDYLAKPFDARELQIRVANLIGQRKNLQDHFRKTLIIFSPSEVKADSMDAVFLQKIRAAVEANLDDETFSVVELGNQIGMSRSQLHRKLTALTGYSPNEVIRNMRLERAKQLLDKKAATVSEIAYLCGFNSPAYFTKCFKEYFGTTPAEV
ncbi:MAG: response regulator [Saprospiraceae bacterium]|nr:response regulator [Saprospiraceae bacterium]